MFQRHVSDRRNPWFNSTRQLKWGSGSLKSIDVKVLKVLWTLLICWIIEKFMEFIQVSLSIILVQVHVDDDDIQAPLIPYYVESLKFSWGYFSLCGSASVLPCATESQLIIFQKLLHWALNLIQLIFSNRYNSIGLSETILSIGIGPANHFIFLPLYSHKHFRSVSTSIYM